MNEERLPSKSQPTVSARLRDGSIIELVHDASEARTSLLRHRHGMVEEADGVALPNGRELAAVPPWNNLIRHGVVLFPRRVQTFPSVTTLVQDIETYVNRYVDLPDDFLAVSIAYVLLSWVYDAFNELPYLRFRGDYGSGKTRALLVIGSICYKPFFASGASTVSPIFHTLDTFQGTLIADETDFRFSDEKAELVKIFNNGNVRGFPVLRSTATADRVFDPRAFSVFGPKIVAMRSGFDDQALESRFLTQEMGTRRMRADIPINLPDVQRVEAGELRDKLLWYRFTMLGKTAIDNAAYDARFSPRLNQIITPLLSVAAGEKMRRAIRDAALRLQRDLHNKRSAAPEAQLLEVLIALQEDATRDHLTVTAVATEFAKKHGAEYDRPITPRYVGHLLRNRLRLVTYKRHGTFVIPLVQREDLQLLAEKYGIGGDPDPA